MRVQLRVAFALSYIGFQALWAPAFAAPVAAKPQYFRAGEQPPGQRAHSGKFRPASRQSHTDSHVENHTAESSADRLISKPVTEPLAQPRKGWPILVREARKYLGTNPTARNKLWCATFMNFVLRKSGYNGTNSDAARSFVGYGHRISLPQIGAIAVLARGKANGHVGVVTGIDPQGNPIIISGNHGHRVGEGIYPRSRVIAYVMPNDSQPSTPATDRAPRASEPPPQPQQVVKPEPSQLAASGAASGSSLAAVIGSMVIGQAHAETRPQLAAQQTPLPKPRPVEISSSRPAEQQKPHRAAQHGRVAAASISPR